MATRTVQDTLYHQDGSPWAGATLIFALRGGFVPTGGFYPPDTGTVTADGAGTFTATLWVSDESGHPTAYDVTLPNGWRTVVHIPTGSGTLTLAALLTGGA